MKKQREEEKIKNESKEYESSNDIESFANDIKLIIDTLNHAKYKYL